MATIRDTILHKPGLSDIDDYLEEVLTNRSLGGDDTYTSLMKEPVNLAAADMYAMIGGLPDFTENKLSMRYPRDWYTQKAKELYIEGGEPEKADALGKKIKVPLGRAGHRW
jgi:hypothetical protein